MNQYHVQEVQSFEPTQGKIIQDKISDYNIT